MENHRYNSAVLQANIPVDTSVAPGDITLDVRGYENVEVGGVTYVIKVTIAGKHSVLKPSARCDIDAVVQAGPKYKPMEVPEY